MDGPAGGRDGHVASVSKTASSQSRRPLPGGGSLWACSTWVSRHVVFPVVFISQRWRRQCGRSRRIAACCPPAVDGRAGSMNGSPKTVCCLSSRAISQLCLMEGLSPAGLRMGCSIRVHRQHGEQVVKCQPRAAPGLITGTLPRRHVEKWYSLPMRRDWGVERVRLPTLPSVGYSIASSNGSGMCRGRWKLAPICSLCINAALPAKPEPRCCTTCPRSRTHRQGGPAHQEAGCSAGEATSTHQAAADTRTHSPASWHQQFGHHASRIMISLLSMCTPHLAWLATRGRSTDGCEHVLAVRQNQESQHTPCVQSNDQ